MEDSACSTLICVSKAMIWGVDITMGDIQVMLADVGALRMRVVTLHGSLTLHARIALRTWLDRMIRGHETWQGLDQHALNCINCGWCRACKQVEERVRQGGRN